MGELQRRQSIRANGRANASPDWRIPPGLFYERNQTEGMAMSGKRLRIALAVYAGLGILAYVLLEGMPRLAVWVFLGGLAVKSWIAYGKDRQES